MPIESVRTSRVVGANQAAGGVPTGTFKVSGDRARITPYAEVIALEGGKLRVMGVTRPNVPRGPGGVFPAEPTTWIVDFDAPGATHKESGTRGELEKYTFESSTRMVGGALVGTESKVDPGGWLKKDTRVTNEKMLKVENGTLVLTETRRSATKSRSGWVDDPGATVKSTELGRI